MLEKTLGINIPDNLMRLFSGIPHRIAASKMTLITQIDSQTLGPGLTSGLT